MGEELTPTGRVFAAVVPPVDAVAALVERLGGLALPGRPVPPPNWHITLRFVGTVEPVPYERWLGGMDVTRLPPPFTVALTHLGAFPRSARATVLWVRADSERLSDLATVVDDAAEAAGLGREERPFRPHLTVARLRPPVDVRRLMRRDDDWRTAFRVEEFHVMAAVGSRYRVFETFSL